MVSAGFLVFALRDYIDIKENRKADDFNFYFGSKILDSNQEKNFNTHFYFESKKNSHSNL